MRLELTHDVVHIMTTFREWADDPVSVDATLSSLFTDIWRKLKELNPHLLFWRQSCYRYTKLPYFSFNLLAERRGIEPPLPLFKGKLAFQARPIPISVNLSILLILKVVYFNLHQVAMVGCDTPNSVAIIRLLLVSFCFGHLRCL